MLLFVLGRLRWNPEAAWRATPREVAAAIDRDAGPQPLLSRDLEHLLRSYPDRPTGD